MQLTNGAVVYFNLDTTVEGNKTFHAKGTPSLYTLVKEIAEMVIVAPENSSTTVSRQANPEDHGADHTVWSLFSGTFGFPSDGSDDGGLALFAGIPSMNQGMSDNDGQYESVYHRCDMTTLSSRSSLTTFPPFQQLRLVVLDGPLW